MSKRDLIQAKTQADASAPSGTLVSKGAQHAVYLRPAGSSAQANANRAFEVSGVKLE